MAKRKTYPLEYRQRMVELVRAGRTPEELSREFEASAGAIRKWVEQAELDEAPFDFLPLARPPAKPRSRALTAIRGPYYTPLGARQLTALLEAAGEHVDQLKFAGGSFTLMNAAAVRRLNDVAHAHDVRVSTGGFIERVVSFGDVYVAPYLKACRELGFDIVEVSSGFLSLSDGHFVRLVEQVRAAGLGAVAEVGIQRGAGGGSAPEALEQAGREDPERAVGRARRALEAGAELILIESEGITEQVRQWRTEVIDQFAQRLGLDAVMFEAADPPVFEWYIQKYGREVNLFVDHSQILQLAALRADAWGTVATWGRSFPPR